MEFLGAYKRLLQRAKKTIQKIRNDVLIALAKSLKDLAKDEKFNSFKTKISVLEEIISKLIALKRRVTREIQHQSQYGVFPPLEETNTIIVTTLNETVTKLNECIKNLETDREFNQMSAPEKGAYLNAFTKYSQIGIDLKTLKELTPKVAYNVDSVSEALNDWVSVQTIQKQQTLIHVLREYATVIRSDENAKENLLETEKLNNILAEKLQPVITKIIGDKLVLFFSQIHQLKLKFLKENPETEEILSNEKYAEKHMILLLEDIVKKQLNPPEHLKIYSQCIESYKAGIEAEIKQKQSQIDSLKKTIKSIEKEIKSLKVSDGTSSSEELQEALEQ